MTGPQKLNWFQGPPEITAIAEISDWPEGPLPILETKENRIELRAKAQGNVAALPTSLFVYPAVNDKLSSQIYHKKDERGNIELIHRGCNSQRKELLSVAEGDVHQFNGNLGCIKINSILNVIHH